MKAIAPIVATPLSAVLSNLPLLGPEKATAIFEYTSQSPNELTISKDEELTILIQEAQGWIKVRGLNGEGIVPATYIKVIESSSPNRAVAAITRQKTLTRTATVTNAVPKLDRENSIKSSNSAVLNKNSEPKAGASLNSMRGTTTISVYNDLPHSCRIVRV